MAEGRGNQIVYLRELRPGERVLARIEEYRATDADHRFALENIQTGMRIYGDHPITRLTFWSRRMGYLPEASIRLRIDAGRTVEWQTRYKFFVKSKQAP